MDSHNVIPGGWGVGEEKKRAMDSEKGSAFGQLQGRAVYQELETVGTLH